jgi:hypothetical protein
MGFDGMGGRVWSRTGRFSPEITAGDEKGGLERFLMGR